jgi:hypothetical protein
MRSITKWIYRSARIEEELRASERVVERTTARVDTDIDGVSVSRPCTVVVTDTRLLLTIGKWRRLETVAIRLTAVDSVRIRRGRVTSRVAIATDTQSIVLKLLPTEDADRVVTAIGAQSHEDSGGG